MTDKIIKSKDVNALSSSEWHSHALQATEDLDDNRSLATTGHPTDLMSGVVPRLCSFEGKVKG